MILTSVQKVDVGIDPRDKKNKPAKVDGIPVWKSSNEAVATVVPSDDGMSASVVAQDLGDTQITVEVDADLGEGVKPLAGTLDVTVNAAEAVSLNITTGTPTDQDAV